MEEKPLKGYVYLWYFNDKYYKSCFRKTYNIIVRKEFLFMVLFMWNSNLSEVGYFRNNKVEMEINVSFVKL